MITKKILAVSCLFLAIPICAMRRSGRVGRMGAGLLRRFSCSGGVRNFALQAAALNNRQRRKQNNRTFKLGGMPVDCMARRLLCMDKEESNDKENLNDFYNYSPKNLAEEMFDYRKNKEQLIKKYKMLQAMEYPMWMVGVPSFILSTSPGASNPENAVWEYLFALSGLSFVGFLLTGFFVLPCLDLYIRKKMDKEDKKMADRLEAIETINPQLTEEAVRLEAQMFLKNSDHIK